jgi:acyl-CoA thioester hydrolase
MTGPIFRFPHRVTYAEITAGNHIYYSRYLDLLEAARGEFFRSLGVTFGQWQVRDVIFPVIECRLRYKSPARYDDVLTVEIWLSAMEKIRLNFAYRIVSEAGVVMVEAETHHVCASLAERPKRLPEELCGRLLPYVHSGASE